MKVYKIYPKYEEETLPPPKVVNGFCGVQISGDVKNPKYDDRSLFGLCVVETGMIIVLILYVQLTKHAHWSVESYF